ncbi:uncharacterized protein LOC144172690 [Haemaphysalis longicornis]
MTRSAQSRLKIWHWNANGLQCRRALLQQHIQTMDSPPDVIMVQETHMERMPTLPGYRTHATPPSARTSNKGAAQGVCTFVRKGITHIPHDRFLEHDTALELCATEIVVGKKTQESLYMINVYSNPQHRSQRFRTPFHKTLHKASRHPILIAGDFNAHHKELGYGLTTAKGRDLLDEAVEAELTLVTDPLQPSRIGTSTAGDTNPDLAFVHLPDGRTTSWRNTGHGSDHYIIEIEIPLRVSGTSTAKRTHKLVDWHAFRQQDIAPTIDDIERWTRCLVDATKRVTTEIETDDSIPSMDPRLEHMWHVICNEADGQLHASRTWKLLRHLKDETQSKSYQQHRLSQILHTASKTLGTEELCKRLNDQYLPITSSVEHPDYRGAANPELDGDIEEWEVRRAVQDLNCKSAAGPENVHNKALRNLNDTAITALTRYYNDCWRSGSLPK